MAGKKTVRMHWMPWDIPAYVADTSSFSAEHHGAYLMLLAAMWMERGPLRHDDGDLAQAARCTPDRWEAIRAKVLAKFSIEDGFVYQHRLLSDLEKATGLSAKRATAGRGGGAGRWGESDGKTRSQRLAEARALGTHSKAEWEALQAVCGDKCVHCGIARADLHGETMTKDHVQHLHKGGSDAIDNIQPSCRNCNSRRGQDATDNRPKDWRELLAKRLANACEMPGQEQEQEHSPSERDISSPAPPPPPPPPKPGKKDYPAEFDACWAAYPNRPGKNKADSFKAWQARMNAAPDPTLEAEAMQRGTERYAVFVRGTGKEGTEYVKQPATFYGPSMHYLSDWTPPPKADATSTTQDRRAATMAGLGSKENHGTHNDPFDVQARVIPDGQ